MKFETQLRRFSHGGPNWPFVHYSHFKTLLKHKHLETAAFFAEFAANVAEVDKFFQAQKEVLESNLPTGLDYPSPDVNSLSCINRLELDVHRQSALELKDSFGHLICYARLNAGGFRRILNKSKRLGLPELAVNDQSSFSALQSLVVHSSQLEHLVTSLEQALKSPPPPAVDSRLLHPSALPVVKKAFNQALPYVLNEKPADLARLSEDPLHSLAACALLELACIYQSYNCVTALLSRPDSSDWLLNFPCMLHLMMRRLCGLKRAQKGNNHGEMLERLMRFLLAWFSNHQPSALVATDELGRLPVYYAVDFDDLNLVHKCLEIMKPYVHSSMSEVITQADFQKKTPLWLAVSRGSVATLKVLLEHFGNQNLTPQGLSHDAVGDAQLLALEVGDDTVFGLFETHGFVEFGTRVKGENLLHAAARLGYVSKIRVLLKASVVVVLLNKPDAIRCWPPLFFACNEGHQEAVKILVEAGADLSILDSFNWLASERAAYKGNIRTLEYLVDQQCPLPRASMHLGKFSNLSKPRDALKVPTSGKSLFLIRLGSANLRNPVPALVFHNEPHRSVAGMQLVVGIAGGVGNKSICINLPLIDTGPNDPLIFCTEAAKDLNVTFELRYPSDMHDTNIFSVVGTGATCLESLRTGLFRNHESLVRDHEVAILKPGTSNSIASVTFNLLTVTPYENVPSSPIGQQGFWKETQGTSVIGHRGSGANKAKKRYLQVGENTIQGFLSASTLGASCIEFDVQLTKDFIPVIYHDFLIKDTGTETPIHTMTKQQFVHIGKAQNSRTDLASAAEMRFEENSWSMPHTKQRPRSRSYGAYDDSRTRELVDRLRVTSYGPTKAVKGNRRGFAIHEPLVTLQEMLHQLPESIAFDLEMKYPMLWEAENQQFEPWAMEVNFFVDTVLNMIFAQAGRRNITFSSFSPEICVLLSRKQQLYPVLFITKAGNVPVGDERASSLQNAVAFANAWGLAGIVTVIKPIQYCPRLVNYARELGCKYATYGTTSDDPETVKMLSDAGLDAIVTNRCRLISETLRDHQR